MGDKISLEIKIEELRRKMYELIDKEDNFLNINIINISQELDKVLNTYNSVVAGKFF